MNKQKVFNVFAKIYTVIMITIFTTFTLSINPENADKFKLLRIRIITALVFFVPGFFSLKFKSIMLKHFYERDGLTFKDETSRQKALEQITNFGSSLSITSIAITIFALVLFLLS